MSVQFSGWEVVHDGSFPAVELAPSQKPQEQGIYTMYHGTGVASARLIIANGFQPLSGFFSVHVAIESLRQISDIKSHLDRKKLQRDIGDVCYKVAELSDS